MAARRLDPGVLRLVLITDGMGDPRRLEAIVEAAVAGGVRCVQVREPKWSARAIMLACERLAPVLEAARGMLLVNDRLDVAAARGAHGAQIGHRSLPPELARLVIGPDAPLGFSAHDLEELDLAAAGDCDFALLSPVWPTTSKPGAPHLGEVLAAQLTARAQLPVVWLGGIDAERTRQLAAIPVAGRPVGVAVRSAIMAAPDPMAAAAELLAAWPSPTRPA
ncbi:MAG: thiamine phosphate synthase [Planctomycetes bacterium]|nr:thiamine phosphate synthase [Planctomycetota bacterium]